MKVIYFLAAALLGITAVQAQNSFGQMQNMIPRDKSGINVFDVKKDSVEFKGLSVDLGAAFAMQFQALDQYNGHAATGATHTNGVYSGYRMKNLSNNFNLPTANMTIGAQLADGVRVNLDVYLSSRHHQNTYVKGGYLQIDKLDFIKEGFMSDFMKYATIKIGHMENNYGDAHFRRTDNGQALTNPFIGNNIMDSFMTEMGMEVYYNRNGWVSMLGVTNSKLNQNVNEVIPSAPGRNSTISPTILAKLGYDKQLNEDLRVRLTGSLYHCANTSANLYASDRAGSRFYDVMSNNAYTYNGNTVAPSATGESNFTTGRFSPGFGNWATSYMINPFVKYKGLEFFSTIEIANGGDKAGIEEKRSFTQFAGDLLYRFGEGERYYVGTRYNTVSGKLSNADLNKVSINRFEAAAGWFMTKNTLAKLSYVNQNYNNFSQYSGNALNNFYEGQFKGLMFEAVISF